MTLRLTVIGAILVFHLSGAAQEKTDVSLFYKRAPEDQLQSVESKRGNLFRKLGHHGPAVENPWYALRIYFNKKTAIDLYSKAIPRNELREKQWYPSKEEQLDGWGADYYKVGKTLGLGGIKLWDGQGIVDLHRVSKRYAEVMNAGDSASMVMVSEGVKYKGRKVDIKVTVTVFAGSRLTRITAETLDGETVQFVSGICAYENLDVMKTDHYIATWGIHPEDVAAEKIAVGGVLFIPDEGVAEVRIEKKQYLVVTKPTSAISFRISAASARDPEINTYQKFIENIEYIFNTP